MQRALDSPVAVSIVQQPPLRRQQGGAARLPRRSAERRSQAHRRAMTHAGRDGRAAPSLEHPAVRGRRRAARLDRRTDARGVRAPDRRARRAAARRCATTACAPGSTSGTWTSSTRTWSRAAPNGSVQAAGPERRHALHRQHRHRGRLLASLRHGADGRLFGRRTARRGRYPTSTTSTICARPRTTTSPSSAATRIAYADRAHHFMSGTASIDGDGRGRAPRRRAPPA